jgi:hypothetical protein
MESIGIGARGSPSSGRLKYQGVGRTSIDITDMKQAGKSEKVGSMYRTILKRHPGDHDHRGRHDDIHGQQGIATQTGYGAREIEGKKSWTEFILKETWTVMGYHSCEGSTRPRRHGTTSFDIRQIKGASGCLRNGCHHAGTKKTVLSFSTSPIESGTRKPQDNGRGVEVQNQCLEEMNAALRVLLKQRRRQGRSERESWPA